MTSLDFAGLPTFWGHSHWNNRSDFRFVSQRAYFRRDGNSYMFATYSKKTRKVRNLELKFNVGQHVPMPVVVPRDWFEND